MKVAIHQPNFLPWLGFFYKIYLADIFILLDNVEYTKNSFINRNSIKIQDAKKWITIPVQYAGNSAKTIQSIKTHNFEKEKKRLVKTIQMAYSKTPFFKHFFPDLENIFLNMNSSYLSDINIELIKWVCSIYSIPTPINRASSFSINSSSTQRLVELVSQVQGTTYIHGKGALKYQENELFTAQNIEVSEITFTPPEYQQLGTCFIPNLSIIDYIFNCGNTNPFIKQKQYD